jgi:hypothetical protein
MKYKPLILLAVGLLLVAACGVHSQSQPPKSAGSSLADARVNHDDITFEAPETLALSQDLRPVDGALTVISLKKKESLTYEATMTTTIVSRRTGKSQTSVDLIGAAMNCSFTARPDASLQQVMCSQDSRPVDGALTTLKISRKGNLNFSVTLRTEAYNRIQHRVMVDTQDLGQGFRRDASQN